MDYKEWFDKLCETHEREMKQAELRGYEEAEKEECRSDATESSVTPVECKYSTDRSKPLRSDSGAKLAKPYPQDTEEDEYRYIDAGWLEAVARGRTAVTSTSPGTISLPL